MVYTILMRKPGAERGRWWSCEMRTSKDIIAADGSILFGYDYSLQVWVKDGIILPCGHPDHMRPDCCAAGRLAGKVVSKVAGHEVRG